MVADRAAIAQEGDARAQLTITTSDGQGEADITVALREERAPVITNARASSTRIGGYGIRNPASWNVVTTQLWQQRRPRCRMPIGRLASWRSPELSCPVTHKMALCR